MDRASRQWPSWHRAALVIGLIGIGGGVWFTASPVIPSSTESVVTLPTALLMSTITPSSLPAFSKTPSATVTLTPKSPTSTAIPTQAPVVHVVKSGEMLLAIAAQYDLSVETVMMVNEITDPTTLQIGQKLLIPVTPTPQFKTSPTPTPRLIFYTIEPGDTLLAIALAHDTTVEALMRANWLNDPTALQIGQKLVIPPVDGSLPDAITWAPTAMHEIESGDTLLSLAVDYGSSVEDILTVNPDLDPTLLQIGQQVKVPLTRQKAGAGKGVAPAKLSPPPSLSAADVAALKAGSFSLVGLEQEMIEAVNAERQAEGLSPLAVDEQLTLMAWNQAHDMAKRGYMSHVTPEGRTLRDRFQDCGLPINWVGENIYLSVKPANQAVSTAVGWFMGDPPHRRNILHRNFTRIGVGVAQQPTGWYNFVLVFAGD